ncbi:SIMPL domain-containing protein [Chloroflexota bacterium]
MKKNWFLVVGLALVLAVVGLAGCSPANTTSVDSQQHGIWVAGEGKVTVVPDVATLSLGVDAQGATVAEAQGKADGAMDSVMASLANNGVASKDIQTQYFSIQKVSRWDPDQNREVLIGYRVTNTVAAKIRDIAKAGAIIDAVAQAGGDLIRINNISFSVDDPTAYYGEVRTKAVADAKAKAQQLAKLAGVSLGKPTYVSESMFTPSPIYRDMAVIKEASAPAVETSISPGETEITINIQMVYDIR